jgi:glycosyltransferase involved in cell wall biosynthesis
MDRYQNMSDLVYLRNVVRRGDQVLNVISKHGHNMARLEAWRQATPVVSLAVDPRRFLDLKECFVYGNTDTLTKLVQTVAQNQTTRRDFGKRARKAFENQYALPKIARQYGNALKQAIE